MSTLSTIRTRTVELLEKVLGGWIITSEPDAADAASPISDTLAAPVDENSKLTVNVTCTLDRVTALEEKGSFHLELTVLSGEYKGIEIAGENLPILATFTDLPDTDVQIIKDTLDSWVINSTPVQLLENTAGQIVISTVEQGDKGPWVTFMRDN